MTLILFLLAVLCVAVPFAVGQRLGTIPLVSPLHLLSYFAFFGVFLKTAYMKVFGGEMFFYAFNLPDLAELEGYLFITLFVICICVGYTLPIRRVRRAHGSLEIEKALLKIWHPTLLVALSFVVAAIVLLELLSDRGFSGVGAAITLEAIHSLNSSKIIRIEGVEGFGESNAAIKQLLFIPTLTLTLYMARFTLWKRRQDLFWLLTLTALELFLIVLQGKRFALLGTLASFVIVPTLLGKRFSFSTLLRMGIGILLVGAVVVVMTNLRLNKGDVRDTTFNVQPVIDQVFGSTYFLDINVPILIVSRTKSEDVFLGASYFYWTYAWIPRSLWPEKPAVTLGPYVKQEILGITGTIGGINPSGPGEAFLNFGWVGILVGVFLGLFYRLTEKWLILSGRFSANFGVWIYSSVGFTLISGTIQSSFSSSLTTAAFRTIGVIALLYLARRMSLQRSARLA